MFAPFVIVIYESLNYPQCEKDESQNHTVTFGKGLNMQKMLEDFSAQDQQRTHEQLSQNIKTVVDHPENDT